jgi:hypothetical protein
MFSAAVKTDKISTKNVDPMFSSDNEGQNSWTNLKKLSFLQACNCKFCPLNIGRDCFIKRTQGRQLEAQQQHRRRPHPARQVRR